MRRLILSALSVALVLPLAACDFTANAECKTDEAGVVRCSGSATPAPTTTLPPSTTLPPVVIPTTVNPPPVTQPPVTVPPTTTTRPVTTPPTTTQPPAPSNEAAVRLGWGTPLPQSDEFNYVGTPDPAKWGRYGDSGCVPGHANNGRRCGDRNNVSGGFLRQSGLANGDSAGLASKLDQKYGKWEVRARFDKVAGANGNPYHAVLIAWPQSDRWPQSGELDFFEVVRGDKRATAFIHYPADTVVQDEFHSGPLDLTQWHNYALSWTPSAIVGYVDGVEWFRVTKGAAQPPEPMHLTIQLDNFHGSGMEAANFDVDWARIYR